MFQPNPAFVVPALPAEVVREFPDRGGSSVVRVVCPTIRAIGAGGAPGIGDGAEFAGATARVPPPLSGVGVLVCVNRYLFPGIARRRAGTRRGRLFRRDPSRKA
ncbi:hypothetical protein AB0B27_21030 [Micromonospora rifamycinica]|uniref:hypothetical protein n=1 Tax=Micromonospora rifamycinica TaxID=291594 RepID=UPI0033C9BD15